MKFILASDPEGKKIITEKIVELVGKPSDKIRVAVINEASAAEEDHRWLVEGLFKVAKTFGGEIDMLNLLSLDLTTVMARIDKADVIWCFGGSTDLLKMVFEKTGFSEKLPKVLEKKVWVGSSAGSCVFGRRPKTKEPNQYNVKEYLAYFDFCIRPHIGASYYSKEQNARNIENAFTESRYQTVYALSGNSAIVVDGEKLYMYGKRAMKIVNGKIVERV